MVSRVVPPRLSRLPAVALLLTRAYVRLWLVAGEIRLLGFSHLLRRIPPVSGDVPVDREDLRRARRAARWIAAASRFHVCRTQCLERSATLHFWLRHAGLPSELRIGVRRQGSEIAAHAWVELAGAVVTDPPEALAPFTPLFADGRADQPTR